MDHQEIFAIATLYKKAKGSNASSVDFNEGFLAGVHFMEILNEERLCGNKEKENG